MRHVRIGNQDYMGWVRARRLAQLGIWEAAARERAEELAGLSLAVARGARTSYQITMMTQPNLSARSCVVRLRRRERRGRGWRPPRFGERGA